MGRRVTLTFIHQSPFFVEVINIYLHSTTLFCHNIFDLLHFFLPFIIPCYIIVLYIISDLMALPNLFIFVSKTFANSSDRLNNYNTLLLTSTLITLSLWFEFRSRSKQINSRVLFYL